MLELCQQGRRFRFWLRGEDKIKTIVAKSDAIAAGNAARSLRRRGGGDLGVGCPLPQKKIFADLSLKEAILRHFKMIISLLCFNTIVNMFQLSVEN